MCPLASAHLDQKQNFTDNWVPILLVLISNYFDNLQHSGLFLTWMRYLSDLVKQLIVGALLYKRMLVNETSHIFFWDNHHSGTPICGLCCHVMDPSVPC